jgi:hypothetical protein
MSRILTPPTRRAQRSSALPAVLAMYLGLAFTVVAAAVPFVDHVTSDVLADHIRSGYPDYSEAKVSSAVAAYLTYLAIIGVLGVVAWLWSIRTTKRGAAAAPILATVMFLLGSAVALTNLFIKETSGERALPMLFGVTGVLPVLPGLIAVALLWKTGRPLAALHPRADARVRQLWVPSDRRGPR